MLWNNPYFPFLSLFGLVDIIIRFKGKHMLLHNTCVTTKVLSYVTTASLTLSVCSVLSYPLCKVGI